MTEHDPTKATARLSLDELQRLLDKAAPSDQGPVVVDDADVLVLTDPASGESAPAVAGLDALNAALADDERAAREEAAAIAARDAAIAREIAAEVAAEKARAKADAAAAAAAGAVDVDVDFDDPDYEPA